MTSNHLSAGGARSRWGWIDGWAVGILAALLLAALAFGALVYAPWRRGEALQQWHNRLTATAHDRQRALEYWLDEMQGDTRMLAAFPTVVSWARGGADHESLEHLRSIFASSEHGDGHHGVWLVDDTAGVAVEPASGMWLASREAVRGFSRSVLAGGARIQFVTDAIGQTLVLFGEPLAGPAGQAGVLVVEVRAADFVFSLLESHPLPTRTGETLLVEEAGDSIIVLSRLRHRPAVAPLTFREVLPSPTASHAARGAADFGEYRDYRGEPVLAVGTRLSQAPWVVVAKVDLREANAPVRGDLWRYTLGAGALLVSFTLLLLALRAHYRNTAKRESVERLRQIALNAADIMYRFRLEPTKSFEYINEAVTRVLGYTPEECYEDPDLVQRVVHPEDMGLLAVAMTEPERTPIELRFIHRNGSVRLLELMNVPAYGEGGRLIALEGVARDITVSEETNRALRESEGRHRALFETSPQGIIYRDPTTGARTLNPAACELLGVTPAEASADLLSHVTVYDDASGRRITGDDIMSTRVANTGEPGAPQVLRVDNRRSGRTRWLLSGTRPLFHEGETSPYLVYTILTDITPLREAEAELRETREMYRAVVENTTDVIARFDRDCRYLYVNPACARYASQTQADLIGRTHREAGHAEDISEKWDNTIRAVFADGLPRESSYTLPGPSGPQHFLWRLFPEFDVEGRVRTVVTWSSDVTAQRTLEAQYQQAQKMEAVGRLAGGVAHDFNNLITAIGGYGAMVMDQLPEASPAREDVAEIVRAGDRAAALTRQLLAFSRKQVLKVDVLDLTGVLQGMELMLRRLIGEDVRLHLDVEQDLWSVVADAGQVEQVVMNLAVNARDAMPGGGTLAIALRNVHLPRGSQRHDPVVPAGDYVALEVRDTGSGMDAATLEHLFEPFFTTKEKGKGTGLGLSTVYGIVRQSDGAIAVSSTPGAGSAFEILLPRAAAVRREHSRLPVAGESTHSGESILVVEDEASVRLLTQRMLERAGYRVRLAESGDHALALEFGPGNGVDLLLTDVVMPGMSGRELARRFRARFPQVRVLYMSGYTDDVIASHGLLEPGVSLLQKPFTIQSLQQAVRATLDQTAALW